jgi:hypothetical protein
VGRIKSRAWIAIDKQNPGALTDLENASARRRVGGRIKSFSAHVESEPDADLL